MKVKSLCYIVFIGLIFGSCSEDQGIFPEDDTINDNGNTGGNGQVVNGIQEVSALPSGVIYPDDNPQTSTKEELGRLLFWDPILSGNLDVSCATCHHPDFAYADGIERSLGVGGVGIGPARSGGSLIDRNSPTILNVAYNGIGNNNNYDPGQAPMFWDNRVESLEAQSIEPILSAVEMRGDEISENEIVQVVIDRLESIPDYVDLFQNAFGSDRITEASIADAIATFERSLIANNSRFDQYMRGNTNVLSDQEITGLNNFIQVGCADCHSGAMFSDFDLHTLSVPNNGINDTGASGTYDFRTPTLRNIELTAPYMHNGAFDSLREVLEFYDDISRGNGNSQNNNINDNQIANDARNLNLNNNQINSIIAFLETLTDTDFDRTIPTSVPSEDFDF